MELTPLTRVQQATVLALVEARRLEAVSADPARAASFLRQAEDRLSQLPLLTSVPVRYGIAYDACHDTGEALLAAYGFRTTNGPGQHEALGRYLRAVFDKPLPLQSDKPPAELFQSEGFRRTTPRATAEEKVAAEASPPSPRLMRAQCRNPWPMRPRMLSWRPSSLTIAARSDARRPRTQEDVVCGPSS